MKPYALIIAAALTLGAAAAQAAGSDDSSPPKPAETSNKCKGTQVWDEKTETCVNSKDSRLDDETRFLAARELAYEGRYERALGVLASMSDQTDDRVLTYLGFINRKTGNTAEAMHYYEAALTRNPDNILARSYMGQGLVSLGQIDAARQQLEEIRKRGGEGTWAEASLREAIETGHTFSY